MGKNGRVLASLVLIFFTAGQVQASKTKIKIIDGVEVVLNSSKPSPPKGILTKLVLTEDLTIGESQEEEEMFGNIVSLAVDGEGKMYLVDMTECAVLVYDQKGQFQKKFGKKGNGPGELNQPTGIQITPAGELMVEDAMNQRLAYFMPDGQFIRNISTAKTLSLHLIRVDSNGNLVGRQLIISDNNLSWEVKKYDSSLNPLFTVGSIPFKNPLQGKINPFSLAQYYELNKDDCILYGSSEEYEIMVFNPEGKLIKRIRKEYKKMNITEEDKERMLGEIPDVGMAIKERIDFPKSFPPYQNYSIDEEGRIFVRTFEKGKGEGEYVFDIFDPEGRYIAKTTLKGQPRAWKNGKLYSRDESEEGFPILKRYSVEWKK